MSLDEAVYDEGSSKKRARTEDEYMQRYNKSAKLPSLISKKDQAMDKFLRDLIDIIVGSFLKRGQTEGLDFSDMSNRLSEEIHKYISNRSPTLGKRVSLIVREQLTHLEEQLVAKHFRPLPNNMKLTESSKLVYNYQQLYKQFMDSPYVLVKLQLDSLRGNLPVKDNTSLLFFTMLTNRRIKNDALPALCVGGRSSCGKSTLFDSVLSSRSMSVSLENGVGRFACTPSQTVLWFHEIGPSTLLGKVEGNIFKSVARAERTTAKKFGAVTLLKDMFVFVTSNSRLLDHSVEALPGSPLYPESSFKQLSFFRGTEMPMEKVKKTVKLKSELAFPLAVSESGAMHIEAIKSRVLEVFCAAQPDLDLDLFPNCSGFSWPIGVCGLFDIVLDIILSTNTETLKSCRTQLLLRYVLWGMILHYPVKARLLQLTNVEEVHLVQQLKTAQQKIFCDDDQVATLLEKLELYVKQRNDLHSPANYDSEKFLQYIFDDEDKRTVFEKYGINNDCSDSQQNDDDYVKETMLCVSQLFNEMKIPYVL